MVHITMNRSVQNVRCLARGINGVTIYSVALVIGENLILILFEYNTESKKEGLQSNKRAHEKTYDHL